MYGILLTTLVFVVGFSDQGRSASQYVSNFYCGVNDASGNKGNQYVFSVQRVAPISAPANAPITIPFDVIRHNDDDVYNKNTHEFVAPVKGVYNFYYSAGSQGSYMAVYLQSSKGSLASAVAGTTNTQASNTVNIELEAGTRVWVQLEKGHEARQCNPACSTFSGYLIRPTA